MIIPDSDVGSAKKVDLQYSQKAILWKSGFAEVEFLLTNPLIQKKNEEFSLP